MRIAIAARAERHSPGAAVDAYEELYSGVIS